MSVHDHHKALIAPLRAALAACDPGKVRSALHAAFAPDAQIRLGHDAAR